MREKSESEEKLICGWEESEARVDVQRCTEDYGLDLAAKS